MITPRVAHVGARVAAPGPPRGHQAFTKAYSENPWQNKGRPRLLDVPLRYVTNAIRGVQKSGIINQNSCKNSWKQSNSEKNKVTLNPVAPTGGPRAHRAPHSFAKAHVGNP